MACKDLKYTSPTTESQMTLFCIKQQCLLLLGGPKRFTMSSGYEYQHCEGVMNCMLYTGAIHLNPYFIANWMLHPYSLGRRCVLQCGCVICTADIQPCDSSCVCKMHSRTFYMCLYGQNIDIWAACSSWYFFILLLFTMFPQLLTVGIYPTNSIIQ